MLKLDEFKNDDRFNFVKNKISNYFNFNDLKLEKFLNRLYSFTFQNSFPIVLISKNQEIGDYVTYMIASLKKIKTVGILNGESCVNEKVTIISSHTKDFDKLDIVCIHSIFSLTEESHNYILRKIKPENLVLGINDLNQLSLLKVKDAVIFNIDTVGAKI